MRNGTSNVVTAALVCAWLVPVGMAAHEGHEHTLMGVVQKIDGTSVDIRIRDDKTKQEKTMTIVLNDKTQLLRGNKPVVLADLKVGERIVVKAVMTKDRSGKDVYTAKQVRLAAVTS